MIARSSSCVPTERISSSMHGGCSHFSEMVDSWISLVRVTGLKTPDDWHNTGLTVILDDKDHITQRWTYLDKGKTGTTIFHYERTGCDREPAAPDRGRESRRAMERIGAPDRTEAPEYYLGTSTRCPVRTSAASSDQRQETYQLLRANPRNISRRATRLASGFALSCYFAGLRDVLRQQSQPESVQCLVARRCQNCERSSVHVNHRQFQSRQALIRRETSTSVRSSR